MGQLSCNHLLLQKKKIRSRRNPKPYKNRILLKRSQGNRGYKRFKFGNNFSYTELNPTKTLPATTTTSTKKKKKKKKGGDWRKKTRWNESPVSQKSENATKFRSRREIYT